MYFLFVASLFCYLLMLMFLSNHTLSHPQDGFDGGGEVCSDPIVLFEVVRVHRDRGVKVVVVAQNFDEVAEGWFTHQRGVVGCCRAAASTSSCGSANTPHLHGAIRKSRVAGEEGGRCCPCVRTHRRVRTFDAIERLHRLVDQVIIFCRQ